MKPMTPRHWWAALMICVLGTLWCAPAASAGEYPIYACAVPGREAADQGPWVAYATGAPAFGSMPVMSCASGWFGRSDATSMHDTYPFAGGFAGFRAAVPVDLPIEIRRVQVNGVISYTRPFDSLGSMATTMGPGDRLLCAGGGECDSTWDIAFAPGTKAALLGVSCLGGGDCKTMKTYSQRWRWTILTAAESQAPQITANGGGLLSGGAQRGSRPLSYVAGDAESGIAKVEVLFDDAVVGERRLSDDPTQCGHRSWNACPTSATGELDVDTTAVSDGAHTVTLRTTDAAGNRTSSVAGVVTVDNVDPPTVVERPSIAGTALAGEVLTARTGRWGGASSAPLVRWKRCSDAGCEAIAGATSTQHQLTDDDVGKSLVVEATAANAIGETTAAESDRTTVVRARTASAPPAAPVVAGPAAAAPAAAPAPNGLNATRSARLVARLAHGKPTRRIRYGSAATITGTLTDEDGRPVAGASLVVSQRVRMAGATPAPVATVTTDNRGTFTYRAPKGPSRELTFGYRAFAADRDFASTTTVTILVRASVSLTTTPSKLRNGKTLRFTGVVRGKPQGKTGPLVDLQVVVHGKWRSFLRGAVRADRHGRFRASYRFLRTRTAQTYRFRAVARQDSAYPYLAGTSKERRVRVRP